MKKNNAFFLLAFLILRCLFLPPQKANAQTSQQTAQSQGSLLPSNDEERITLKSYCDFLNAATAPLEAQEIEDGSWKIGNFSSDLIARIGMPGSYVYQVIGEPEAVMSFLSWNDAAHYCEWKNSSQRMDAGRWNIEAKAETAHVDGELKSNLLTFCLVSSEAKANQAMWFEDAGEDDAYEYMAAGAAALFGGGARSGGRQADRTRAVPTNPRPVYRNNASAEQGEKDFTQNVLSWRLGSIKKHLEEATSAPALPLTNDSHTAYYDQLLPFILEEARAAIEKGLGENNRPFQVTIKYDVTEPRNRGNPWIMHLEGAIPEDQEKSASMNVLLLQHKSGMKFLVLANGKKEECELKAKILLSPATVAEHRSLFNRGSRWSATYVTSLITHQRQYDACIKKAKPDCLSRIVKATIHTPIERNDFKVGRLISTLNDSQQRAVQSFIAAPNGSTTLLQGPPGTGKTTTIVSLLRVLCHQDQRTLVCAPSNKAVQVLAERYLKDHPNIPVILAGVESKISEELRPIFLHTWREDLRKTFSTNLEKLISFLNPLDLSPLDSPQPGDQKKEVQVKKEGPFKSEVQQRI